MSLKLIHFLFILFCVVTSVGFGLWTVLLPGLPGEFRFMGTVSLVGGIGLAVYGVRFLRKAKTIIT